MIDTYHNIELTDSDVSIFVTPRIGSRYTMKVEHKISSGGITEGSFSVSGMDFGM